MAGACSSSGNAEQGQDPADDANSEQTETTAAQADETEPTETTLPPIEQLEARGNIYVQDFDAPVSDEWSSADTASSSTGDRTVLGPFGNERVTLQLERLPDHELVKISFELLILGDWTGADRNGNQWLLSVDGSRVVDTTFANTEALQAYPGDLPSEDSAAGTGSTDRSSFGFTAASQNPDGSDSVYLIEREFLHSGGEMIVDLIGRPSGLPTEQAWAIDNLVIEAEPPSDREQVTELQLTVVDRTITVSGVVPGQEDLAQIEAAVGADFRGKSTVDVTVGNGGPKPLWLYNIGALVSLLAPSVDLQVAVDESTATATGTVRTAQWSAAYDERLRNLFGDSMTTESNFAIAFDETIVSVLENIDLKFETGSFALDDVDRAALDEVATVMLDNPELVLLITGHTDATGEDDNNKFLSRDRADASRQYLQSLGVDAERMSTSGYGPAEPLVDPEVTEEDKAANRRVSVGVPRG